MVAGNTELSAVFHVLYRLPMVYLAMHALMLWCERHSLYQRAMLGLCDRWDSADTSMGHYQQPPQQQQHHHASKAPGVFTQLPPPQQLSANGVSHPHGIFSHSAPPLQAASILSHCAFFCSALVWAAHSALQAALLCASNTGMELSSFLASLAEDRAAVMMTWM